MNTFTKILTWIVVGLYVLLPDFLPGVPFDDIVAIAIGFVMTKYTALDYE